MIIASLLLSVINPNLAILLSGLGIVVTADVSTAELVVGAWHCWARASSTS